MKALHKTAFVLLLIGGLNWGLFGLGNYMGSNWNVVNLILGSWPSLKSHLSVRRHRGARYHLQKERDHADENVGSMK